MTIRELATGLEFPEGPVALEDGSVLVVEIAAGRITRIRPDGTSQAVAQPGGGPNGLAVGPDGALYVCNNGGSFEFHRRNGFVIPGHAPASHRGGRIERIALSTGRVDVLFDHCEGQPLIAPNDLVFDARGGFWFTDHGRTTGEHRTHGALYYATADGSAIVRVLRELVSPNGVGLSPDSAMVYFAETVTARLWGLPLAAPGVARKLKGAAPAAFIGAFPRFAMFDSLGVLEDGGVCVATLIEGGIATFDPVAKEMQHLPLPDPLVTNICWGGGDRRTAYVTASATGKLFAIDWPKPGLKLAYEV